MISGLLLRLASSCGGLRWAGVKATGRGAFRPAVPSGDALRRSTTGKGKSHAPGCAPVRRTVWRPAAAACDGRGQKRRGGMLSGLPCRLPTGCAVLRRAGAKATGWDDLRPVAASTDRLRLSATGKGKSHLPGCSPASGGVCRPAAPLCDGQE